tara:strand:- start:410 stop:892 length:483 start_codon:yes stop_codon:yes gene_type:complete
MAIRDTSKKRFGGTHINPNFRVGIDLPITRDEGGDGYFLQSKTTYDAVKNNIRMLLNTQLGERLMQPKLGINLRQYLFENISEDSYVTLQQSIIRLFRLWLPFVIVKDIDIKRAEYDNDINRNSLVIKVSFFIESGAIQNVIVNVLSDGSTSTEQAITGT